VEKEITRVRLYISGLGYYEAYLNGRKVGDHLLDPGWTQYAKTVYYSAYDVTGYLTDGGNVTGVMLGNGWYNPLPMQLFGRFNLRETLTVGQPKVMVQLRLRYADGSAETLVTDTSWTTADGPVIRNNVYLGEWYDARKEKDGWDLPAYDDRGWRRAVPADAPAGRLRWQYVPPPRPR
jgi:alpha-L-rhamnosidase